jgi:hypothetical protein
MGRAVHISKMKSSPYLRSEEVDGKAVHNVPPIQYR